MTARIRLEERHDRDAALEVERIAFGSDEEPSVVRAVWDEEGSFALVAEEDDELVGHVQFSRAWVGEAAVVALGPVAVRTERRGRGIGTTLIAAGLEEARRRGETTAIVLGDPGFYPRFGFEPASAVACGTPSRGPRLGRW